MSASTLPPRAVVITRQSNYQLLLWRHGSRAQAEFFLKSRGQAIGAVERNHERFQSALQQVLGAIPMTWRRSRVDRTDLDRFVFEPADVVVAIGQDGLVANVAKYLQEQRVIGINPDPESYDGVLVPHAPGRVRKLLSAALEPSAELEPRTMVEARLDDGQRLLALNEVFVGHRTHQSARYRIVRGDDQERHSSSGIIVSTGTGATGWARSIHRQRRTDVALPAPTDRRLAFFVREAFPSRATGTQVTEGVIDEAQCLEVISEMNEDGVVFGDGIEDDRIDFAWGMKASLRVSDLRLMLLRG
jgi:NAD kinase